MRNLASKIEASFAGDVVGLLKLAGRSGDALGYAVYAVGGFVRDLLLGVENFDIDLTVEGDGIAFASCLGEKRPGKVVKHKRFGTATVFLKSGHRIDVASARKELYHCPAALPDVRRGSIHADLLRRDFTINALALRLNPGRFGELVDLFNGKSDLRKGVIRVLHDLSFEDDPTRIFRAVRFSHRFGFRIERRTRALMKDAIERKTCDRLSGRRVRNEIYLLLREKDAVGVIKEMARFGVLGCIHTGLRLDPEKFRVLRRIDRVALMVESGLHREVEKWLVYFLGVLRGLKKGDLNRISKRLMLSRKEKEALLFLSEAEKICGRLSSLKKHTPSIIYRALESIPAEVLVVIAAMAKSRNVETLVLKYVSDWRWVKVSLTGEDLMRLGFEPGPDFGKILEKVLYAKMNGCLKTKRDETAYVQKEFSHSQGKKGGGKRDGRDSR
jgi:tRNA nucleotidyltransferase (CCA-adding enzyme)